MCWLVTLQIGVFVCKGGLIPKIPGKNRMRNEKTLSDKVPLCKHRVVKKYNNIAFDDFISNTDRLHNVLNHERQNNHRNIE